MSLRQEVQQELSNLTVGEEIVQLVLAALAGEDEIERVLAGGEADGSEEPADAKAQVPPIFLQDITVEGFRGIGPESTLEISPGPGLTVVVGRNGSGKSSFSEALEVLLTGASYRWKGKTVSWKENWRNLHKGDNSEITARFQVKGMNEQTIVQRRWDHGSELEESDFFVQHDGQSHSNLDGIGWDKSLDLYRPILSYNELSIIEDRPSTLYDILYNALGLKELSVADKNLDKVRRNRQDKNKKRGVKKLKGDIILKLDGLEDEGSKKVRVALSNPCLDLETIETIKNIIDSWDLDSSYRDLRDVMNILVPDKKQVTNVAKRLSDACTSLSNLSGTEAEKAEHLVELLRKALEHYKRHHNRLCPVCGGVLDDAWHSDVLEQIKNLEDTAQSYRKASNNRDSALKDARRIVFVPKLPVSNMVDTEELISAWNQWTSLPDNKDDVSEHLLSQYSVVRDKAAMVSEQAKQIFSDQKDRQNTLLPELRDLISRAHEDIKGEKEISKIMQAKYAIKAVTSSLRSNRWSPIATQALDLWKDLRLQSNINLRSVELAGSLTKRKVDLKVDIGGIEADALSVASQGELSCLALSLFFPRAMLPSSPFRFIVVDDPVQAMDMARVDGLARVLAKEAKERQLIVFTQDHRLPESLNILGIEHYLLEVRRTSDNSVVKVSKKGNPVYQYFKDARDVMKDENFSSSEIAKQVISGLCRSGLEAACVEAIWRKGLKEKREEDARESIEKELLDARKLNEKASLVLSGRKNRGGKVYKTISNKWGKKLADAYTKANEGSHPNTDKILHREDLPALIKDCHSLSNILRGYNV